MRDKPVRQVTVGQVQLPLAMIVTPKLLPLPFDWAVTVPLVPLTAAFQLFCTLCPPPRPMVTVQLLAPLTATFRLNRSPHCWPADSVAVQLPPGFPGVVGPVVGVVGVPPPPSRTVMSELPLLW